MRISYMTRLPSAPSLPIYDPIDLPIISNTFHPPVRWHMTRRDERAVQRVTNSQWGGHWYVSILFIHPDQIPKGTFHVHEPSTRSPLTPIADADTGMTVGNEVSTLTAKFVQSNSLKRLARPDAESSRPRREDSTCGARAGHRLLAREMKRNNSFPVWGRSRGIGPVSLSFRGPTHRLYPSAAMTLVGPTGWPLRLSPAALLAHGNRLYREAYLSSAATRIAAHDRGIGFGE